MTWKIAAAFSGLLLLAASASAQTVIQKATFSKQPSSSGTVTVTLPQTTAAGHALIVGLSFWPADIASVSDNSGDSFTRGLTTSSYHNVSQGVLYSNFYYAKSTAGGATNITLNFNGGSTYVLVAVAEVSGIDTSSPLAQAGYNESLTSASPWLSASITASANEYLFSWAADEWTDTSCSNPSSGWTLESQTGDSAGATVCLLDRTTPTAGSYQASITPSSAFNYAMELVAFKTTSVVQRYTFSVQPSSSGTVNLTLPQATKAGDALIVGLSFWPQDITSVSDGSGDTFTRGLSTSVYHNTSYPMYTNFYYATAAAGGTTSLTLNFSGGRTYVLVAVAEVSGLSTSPVDQSSYHESLTGTTSWSSASVTTTSANEYLFSWAATEQGTTTCSSPGSGWILESQTNDSAGATVCLLDQNTSATGPYQASVTSSASDNYAMEIVTFNKTPMVQKYTFSVQPSSTGTVNLGLPQATKAGDALIVGLSFWPQDITSVSDGSGDNFTRGLSTSVYRNSSYPMYTNFYYAASVAGGTTSLTLQFSGGRTYVLVAVAEVSGLSTSPVDQSGYHDSSTGTTSWSSASVTTTSANEYLFSWAATEQGNTTCSSPGSGWILESQTNDSAGAAVCLLDRNTSATGPYQASVTSSASDTYSMEIITLVNHTVLNGPNLSQIRDGISGVTITAGTIGQAVTIYGGGFGTSQGSSTVTFNGTAATSFSSWQPNQITTYIPTGATTGNVVVTVGGIGSNSLSFSIVNNPTITLVNPSNAGTGMSVQVVGAGFGDTQGSNTVTVNGVSVSASAWAHAAITFTVPAGLSSGNVIVTVGGVASNAVPFTVIPTPTINSVFPSSGGVGTVVQVAGGNFGTSQGSSTITINGTSVGNVSGWSQGVLTFTLPAGLSSGNLVVTVGGVASNAVPFRVVTAPIITTISPSSGGAGQIVQITGANFGASQGTSTVTINGTSVGNPYGWGQGLITFAVPTGISSGSLVVTVGGAPSNAIPFTVLVTPYISTYTPLSGGVGQPVSISGSNFGSSQGTSTVKFNGIAANVSAWANTYIVALVPSAAASGNLVVTVGGAASNSVPFVVATGPSVTSVSPHSGPIGALITISGTDFGGTQGTSAITFNGTVASPSTWNWTNVVVPVPSGATSGNIIVTVGGVVSNAVAFTVNSSSPSITSISPAAGTPGTSVTITGLNFGATQGTSTVTFNGIAATPTSWSATSIVVPVPSGATTGNLLVNVAGVQSNATPFQGVPDPIITSLSLTQGPIGMGFVIQGANFGASQGSSTVQFNGMSLTPSSWSSTGTAITVQVPASAVMGQGVLTVTVSSKTLSSNFTVISAFSCQ